MIFSNEFGESIISLRDKIEKRTDSKIVAIQFSFTYKKTDSYEYNSFIYSTDRYTKLLDDFLKKEGSIIFPNNNRSENYSKIESKSDEKRNEELSVQLVERKKIRVEEKDEDEDLFSKWNSFLSTESFGKFSLWLSLFGLKKNYSLDIFIILDKDISEHLPKLENSLYDDEADFKKVKFRLRLFGPIYKLLNSQGIDLLSKTLNSNLLQKSLKSSLSAVMARNMSHNIGSHVLSRVVDIQSLKAGKLIKDNQYKGLFNGKDEVVIDENVEQDIEEQVTKKLESLGVVNNPELEKIVEQNIQQQEADKRLVAFNAYLRTRQDFLADIVSVTPQIQNTKKLVGDLLKEFDSNRILLNRISGIDKFEFKIKADIEIDNEIKEDVEVAISNDLIGQHAFYIITENIIRNTAKHSKKSKKSKEKKPIEFTIRVRESELDSSLYSITIFDSIKYKDEDLVKIKKEDYEKYKVEYDEWCEDYEDSDNKIKRIDKLITDQNIRINKKILTDNYELRTDALGLIEMQACASYLRQIDLEDISSHKLVFLEEERDKRKQDIKEGIEIHRILRAVNPKNEKDEDKKLNVLGYRFYLPKPKELLIIDTTGDFFDNIKEEVKIKDFESKGVLLLDAREEPKIEDKKYHFNENRIYPHEQMLVWGDIDCITRENFSLLPKRYIFKDDFEKIFNLCKKGDFSLENYITKPKELNTEVLKAVVRKKADEKKVYSQKFKEIKKISPQEDHIQYHITDFHHGDGFKEDKDIGSYREIYASKHKELIDSCLVKDIKLTADDGSGEWEDNPKWIENKKLKYIDGCLNNVLVLDERIQEKSENKYPIKEVGEKSYRELWGYVNVVIPTKDDVNLLAKSYKKEYVNNIKELVKNNFLKSSSRICKGLDYVVIHLGVIEKLLSAQNKNKDDNKERKKLIESLFSDLEVKPKIVITSGRAPRDLPKEYSFITFSTCSNVLIESRLKYLLNEVLNSSRPKINTK